MKGKGQWACTGVIFGGKDTNRRDRVVKFNPVTNDRGGEIRATECYENLRASLYQADTLFSKEQLVIHVRMGRGPRKLMTESLSSRRFSWSW